MFEDSLEIIYDATQGQTGLVGATKVYMHSAAEMVPFGGWQNQVGNWGQDDGIGQMTSLGNDRWRIRILPYAYYSYASSVSPNGLFMVFRNADGSATGKDATGQDIWVDMGQDPPISAFGGVQLRWVRDALDSLLWSDGSHGPTLTINGPGTYWVQMTDTSGCMATDSIIVNLGSIPLVNLGQPALCNGASAVLDAGAGFASYAWSTGDTTQTITVSSGGIITVTVTNAAGCMGSDIVNVTSGTPPTAQFSVIYNGFTLQFIDGSSGGPTSYLWDYGDGSAPGTIPGSHSHDYFTSNLYNICLIVSNACGADTLCLVEYAGEIGFAEPWAADVQLYPNPVHDKLHLELSVPKGIVLDWQIVDAKGEVLRSGNERHGAGNVAKEFELQALPRGIYRLVLRADGKMMARSFLKL